MGRVYLGHIDPDYLWERFDYKPLTGELIRRYTDQYGHRAGTPVGSKTPRGYLVTPIKGRRTLVHRIIYAWVTGAEPSPELHIHHLDHDPSNNAWNNLAVVTPAEHSALHKKKG